MQSIAIIGAGISGITLANQLQDCARVSVFDKSRSVGGRMATRRAGAFQFDHGAQFLTARSRQFQDFVNNCVDKNLLQAWHPRILTFDAEVKPFKREWFEPHFVGVPSMNNLCKALAQDLNVSMNTRVCSVEKNEKGWLLTDSENRALGIFDWLITTLPAPQAFELLPEGFSHRSQLNEVQFSACFSLMLGFKSPPKLNFDAAVVRNSPLAWIAANSSKPDRPDAYSLVVHSDNTWAQSHQGCDVNDVRKELLESVDGILGESLPEKEHIALHRWAYARAESSSDKKYLVDKTNRLAACGDWCGGGRVEDAYLSGLMLGELLRDLNYD